MPIAVPRSFSWGWSSKSSVAGSACAARMRSANSSAPYSTPDGSYPATMTVAGCVPGSRRSRKASFASAPKAGISLYYDLRSGSGRGASRIRSEAVDDDGGWMRSGQPPQQKGFLRVRPKGGNQLVRRLEQLIGPGREQNLLLSQIGRAHA